jgi:hypothetical protein
MKAPFSRCPISGLCVAAGLYLAAAPGLWAHEQWVDVDNFRPPTNATVSVHVRSGHYFPKSSFAVKESVLEDVRLFEPGNKEGVPVATTAADKEHSGVIVPQSPGVHLLCVTLKRTRAKQPNHESKTILLVGEGDDDTTRYARGQGLELVPTLAVSKLTTDGELPFFLMLDGKPIPGSIEASCEGRKSAFLKTNGKEPARLRLSGPGRYLVTANVSGRGCSLVFELPASPEATE